MTKLEFSINDKFCLSCDKDFQFSLLDKDEDLVDWLNSDVEEQPDTYREKIIKRLESI